MMSFALLLGALPVAVRIWCIRHALLPASERARAPARSLRALVFGPVGGSYGLCHGEADGGRHSDQDCTVGERVGVGRAGVA
ncbi:Hypothetical protein A7982_07996 [Minicystis rosea]|nr:Hypothetical protein A7982_07996 [Minicystis rosea]